MNTKSILGALAIAALVTSGCGSGTKSGRGFHPPSGDAERGKVAFVQLNCRSCHAVAGVEVGLPATQRMRVTLGGTVRRARTYGDLVTAIIDPSRELTLEFAADPPRLNQTSPMRNVNREITVEQLIDIVTFLEQHYQVVPPPMETPIVAY